MKIAPRNNNNLSHFFKSTKDPIPKLDTANVVYNIPCSDFTAALIGTTKRPTKYWNIIHAHKKDVYNPPENGLQSQASIAADLSTIHLDFTYPHK